MDKLEQINAMIGRTVTWTSGAQGTYKEKTGKILAFIPAGKEAILSMVSPFSKTQIKFDSISQNDRFLIEVFRFHKRTGEPIDSHYYAPKVSTFLK
jgi:hypothetical protein